MDHECNMPLSGLFTEDRQLLRLAAGDPVRALAYIDSVRWVEGADCPSCGSEDTYAITGRSGTARKTVACRTCRHQFGWRIATPFAGTRVQPEHVLYAVAGLLDGDRPEVVAVDVEREFGCGVRMARLVLNRVLMLRASLNGLGADDEIDQKEVVRWLPVAAIAATATILVCTAFFAPSARAVNELNTHWTFNGDTMSHRTIAFVEESYWDLTRRHAREVAQIKGHLNSRD